jgi:phospholipase D1/2
MDDGDSEALPQNTILKTLLARLEKAIVDDIKRPKFHIYITLPVHPEGALTDPAITAQVYYTMQTLVFGSHSLINGIRRLIKARQLKDRKEINFKRVITDPRNKEHETVDISDCYDYITLLNLRNWMDIKGNCVTEQIYIHSKMMIVDDRFAIVGSANINDRSLLGERDSELSVLVKENNSIRADINEKGSDQPVRIFAHELRMKVWSKIFGVTGNIRPADLKLAIEQPGHPESWKKIQEQAKINAALYEDAFPYIPRNFNPLSKLRNRHASILPTWNPELKQKDGLLGGVGSPLPFQDEFWSRQQSTEKREYLKDIKGFITDIPIHWTEGENLRIKLLTAILVNNEIKNSEEELSDEELLAENKVTDPLKVESSS